MALTRQEISARHYRNRKDNGLCPRCGKELDREGHYCTECLAKVNEYERQTKKFMKSIGICPECKKEKLFGQEKQCISCREKRRKRKPPTDEQRQKYNKSFREKQNLLYRQRIEQGFCGECGKRKIEQGRSRCRICLQKNAEISRKKRMEKINIREYRKANGLCYYCGETADSEKQMCKSCYERCVANGKKSAANSYWRLDNKSLKRSMG